MPGKPTVSEELPPLDCTQSRLLPIADAFMMLMLSRPGGGSLRTTRVTLATIWLSAGVSLVVGIPGLLLIGYAVFRLEWLVLPSACCRPGTGLCLTGGLWNPPAPTIS